MKMWLKIFNLQCFTRRNDVWEKIWRYTSKLRLCVLWFFETKFVIKTQRRYGTQCGKDPPSDNVIRRWLKQFAAIERVTTANAGEILEGNWIALGQLTCHERRAFWSWSFDLKINKTFWVTSSYSVSSFVLFFRFENHRPRKRRQ
jgi:hypothetical protein